MLPFPKVTCQHDGGFCSQCHRELRAGETRACRAVVAIAAASRSDGVEAGPCPFLGPLTGKHHKPCCAGRAEIKEYFCLNPRRMWFAARAGEWQFGLCTEKACQDKNVIQACDSCQLRAPQPRVALSAKLN